MNGAEKMRILLFFYLPSVPKSQAGVSEQLGLLYFRNVPNCSVFHPRTSLQHMRKRHSVQIPLW